MVCSVVRCSALSVKSSMREIGLHGLGASMARAFEERLQRALLAVLRASRLKVARSRRYFKRRAKSSARCLMLPWLLGACLKFKAVSDGGKLSEPDAFLLRWAEALHKVIAIFIEEH